MRKIYFYLFVLKKVFLLLIYPLFEVENKVFAAIRNNMENFIIFQPSKLRARRVHRELLNKINPQRFINKEGIKLYAWFIKPKENMPVILHLHGQAESILSHQDVAKFCLDNGMGLFMLSYRGHYKSAGKPSEQGLYNDAKAALKQLKKLGVERDKIILWGHSLGTCVAVETAIKNNVSGVILQCPIKEIKSAAKDVFSFYCDKLKQNLLGKATIGHLENINFSQKLDNLEKIKNIECPILIMHAKGDKVAPFENSIKLHEQNPKSELFISEIGNHWDTSWCFEKTMEFINSLELEPVLK